MSSPAKPWQHSSDNSITYNICDDYMQVMMDGAALYSWQIRGVVFSKNVGKALAANGPANYLDDDTDNSLVQDNYFWSNTAGFIDNTHKTTNQ